MNKGILTALDGEIITPRTGKESCKVGFSRLPKHGDYIQFIYIDEDCESPGVVIATDNVTVEVGVYFFEDIDGRPFKLDLSE